MSVAIVSLEDQNRIRIEKYQECQTLISLEASNKSDNGCERVWDSLLCWPPTENGTVASMPCPNYVNGFKISGLATRTCDSTGEWWVNPLTNGTWTNFTLCADRNSDNLYDVPKIIAAHMGRIQLMYNIGYGISLVSLLLAVAIMIYFKRLHCPRNTIHINLFVSFIFRAIISFVKENALVNQVGFSFDVEVATNGNVRFLEDSSHWQCKTFFSMFNYILGANYMWIFTEGIYLHMLITVAMFSEKSGIKKLVLFGWGTPILFVIPWVIVRATLEDVLCWNTHPTHGYFWMIRGPMVVAMVVNFFIFLNIIRVLFTKLNAFKTPDVKRYRYRKLAKSTLVLIPLFGVHYIVFIGLPDDVDETTELVKLYWEMFFNSFQGFLVSLLFCFLNGEVQTEIKKKWKRYIIKRGGSGFRRAGRETMTSYVSRARGSVASTSATMEKDIPNGKTRNNTDKNTLNGGSSSDNSVHNEQNGLVIGDHEAHPMIEITPPAAQHYRNEDSPLMFNNNENIKHEEPLTKD
ncbi:secretin receptor-like isoform X2 [Ruditapes philippinarum]|uniref:secretin receptor-like isoform X2 n=1 Tax=Ruditapes philippinarum TaxID=129788 RepID=UPI00295BC49A|nr:secretin receptor-like isoform X2 [Ruditapes philippinarum]XP_060584375.1 secretin receptor-like isoform X2 [Ruditapes philippinarum]